MVTNKEENKSPWYALRFFSNRDHKIEKFLESREIVFFIPMLYKYKAEGNGEVSKPKKVLSPVCAHLLFIRKDKPEDEIIKNLLEYHEPVKLYRLPGCKNICEISADEMFEFRMMCDSGLKNDNVDFLPPIENLEGAEVIITKGPFAGVRGIIKREKHRNGSGSGTFSKNLFVVKNYGCVAVRIRIINGMFRRMADNDSET
jgi:Transcription termination factor nusG.